jgi:hypothetical protein
MSYDCNAGSEASDVGDIKPGLRFVARNKGSDSVQRSTIFCQKLVLTKSPVLTIKEQIVTALF